MNRNLSNFETSSYHSTNKLQSPTLCLCTSNHLYHQRQPWPPPNLFFETHILPNRKKSKGWSFALFWSPQNNLKILKPDTRTISKIKEALKIPLHNHSASHNQDYQNFILFIIEWKKQWNIKHFLHTEEIRMKLYQKRKNYISKQIFESWTTALATLYWVN